MKNFPKKYLMELHKHMDKELNDNILPLKSSCTSSWSDKPSLLDTRHLHTEKCAMVNSKKVHILVFLQYSYGLQHIILAISMNSCVCVKVYFCSRNYRVGYPLPCTRGDEWGGRPTAIPTVSPFHTMSRRFSVIFKRTPACFSEFSNFSFHRFDHHYSS